MKHESLEILITAIETVLRGEIYLNKTLSARIIKKFAVNDIEASSSLIDLLSDRELEVFRLIGQGYRTREIADRLTLSFRTIEAYRSRLKQKLNLQNGDSLVQEAIHWVKREECSSFPA